MFDTLVNYQNKLNIHSATYNILLSPDFVNHLQCTNIFLRNAGRGLIVHRTAILHPPTTRFPVIMLYILQNNFFSTDKINDVREKKNLNGDAFCKLILPVSLKHINNFFAVGYHATEVVVITSNYRQLAAFCCS